MLSSNQVVFIGVVIIILGIIALNNWGWYGFIKWAAGSIWTRFALTPAKFPEYGVTQMGEQILTLKRQTYKLELFANDVLKNAALTKHELLSDPLAYNEWKPYIDQIETHALALKAVVVDLRAVTYDQHHLYETVLNTFNQRLNVSQIENDVIISKSLVRDARSIRFSIPYFSNTYKDIKSQWIEIRKQWISARNENARLYQNGIDAIAKNRGAIDAVKHRWDTPVAIVKYVVPLVILGAPIHAATTSTLLSSIFGPALTAIYHLFDKYKWQQEEIDSRIKLDHNYSDATNTLDALDPFISLNAKVSKQSEKKMVSLQHRLNVLASGRENELNEEFTQVFLMEATAFNTYNEKIIEEHKSTNALPPLSN